MNTSCVDSARRPDAALNDLGYSLRRWFIDEFHFRHVAALAAGSRVLDLGGNKVRNRGAFDLGAYPLRVVYANLVTDKQPDVQCDAHRLPFADATFDAVICAEVLEHVTEPPAVLAEAARVLRPGGRLLVSVPFLVPIHGDPHDYGRYTDAYWQRALAAAGFGDVAIERQGGFWCVLVDAWREYVCALRKHNRPRWSWWRRRLHDLVCRAKRRALRRDAAPAADMKSFSERYTTGFGIKAVRP